MNLEKLKRILPEKINKIYNLCKRGVLTYDEAYRYYKNAVFDLLGQVPSDSEERKKYFNILSEAHIFCEAMPKDIEQVYTFSMVERYNGFKNMFVSFEIIDLGDFELENFKYNKEYNITLREIESCNQNQLHHCSIWIYDQQILDINKNKENLDFFRQLPNKIPFSKIANFQLKEIIAVDYYIKYKWDPKPKYRLDTNKGKSLYYHGVGYIDGYIPFECVLLHNDKKIYSMVMLASLIVKQDHPRWKRYYEQEKKFAVEIDQNKKWFEELISKWKSL